MGPEVYWLDQDFPHVFLSGKNKVSQIFGEKSNLENKNSTKFLYSKFPREVCEKKKKNLSQLIIEFFWR